MVPAQVWTTDWGQVATGRFGKAGEPVAFPRALRSQAGGAPSTIRRAPPRPCRAGSAHTRRPSRRPPHRLGPRCPACSTARPRLLRRRCSHCGRGTLVVGAGPWARIAPGVDHGEGTPPKARARRPLDGPGAHRVGDLRGPSPRSGPHRSWTPGGARWAARPPPNARWTSHCSIEQALAPTLPPPHRGPGPRVRPPCPALQEPLGAPLYFCQARCPWQRGTGENTNGLLREAHPHQDPTGRHQPHADPTGARSTQPTTTQTPRQETPEEAHTHRTLHFL